MRIKPSYPRLRLDHPLARGLISAHVETNSIGVKPSGLAIENLAPAGPNAVVSGSRVTSSNGPWGSTFDKTESLGSAGMLLPATIGDVSLGAFVNQRWSFCFWGKININSANQHFFVKGAASNGAMYVRVSARTASGMLWSFRGGSDAGGSNTIIPVSVGVWNHWVAVWDGDTVRNRVDIYRDGRLQGSSTPGTSTSGLGQPIAYMMRSTGSQAGNVAMDDIRIYDRPLSSSEVQEIFTNGWEVYREPNRFWRFGFGTDGLKIGFDASRITATEGQVVNPVPEFVSGWNASSVIAERRPTYHFNQTPTGKPALRWAGGGGVDLAVAARGVLRNKPGGTILAVHRPKGDGARVSQIFIISRSGSTAYRMGMSHIDSSKAIRCHVIRYTPGTQLTVSLPTRAYQDERFIVSGARVDYAGSSIAKVDLHAAMSQAGLDTAPRNFNDADSASVQLAGTFGSNGYIGEIGLVLMWDRYLSDAEYRAVERMVAEQWTKIDHQPETADALMPMLGEENAYTQLHLFQGNDGLMTQLAELNQYIQDHQLDTADGFMPQEADLSKFIDETMSRTTYILDPEIKVFGRAILNPELKTASERSTDE